MFNNRFDALASRMLRSLRSSVMSALVSPIVRVVQCQTNAANTPPPLAAAPHHPETCSPQPCNARTATRARGRRGYCRCGVPPGPDSVPFRTRPGRFHNTLSDRRGAGRTRPAPARSAAAGSPPAGTVCTTASGSPSASSRARTRSGLGVCRTWSIVLLASSTGWLLIDP